MTIRRTIGAFVANEELNFLLTNRIPRRLATNFLGWFSKIERPWVAKPSIAVWRLFSDVDLADAAETRWKSMHDCFTRTLKPGARAFVQNGIASPCDAIVGANGPIAGDEIHQIKGAPYRLSELLGSQAEAAAMIGGSFVTLRLTAGMYHHFHAPCDLTVERVTYISGDCWNVNSPALKRVQRLYCKNERAAVYCRLPDGRPLVLVAVAAVLVACIRLTFLDTTKAIRIGGPRTVEVGAVIARGEDMGWFEHGSTIVALLPEGMALDDTIAEGRRLKAGEALAS